MPKHNLPLSLDRALALHTAALAILGALFVGQGSEKAFIPVATAIAAVTAVAVTDVLGVVRLNRWLANAISIGAVAWSLREFLQIASDEKLMAIANMLCYLQIVLLFQAKSPRVYWQLVVLSILQVVVGAALDAGPTFGLFVGLYATVALSTLTLLCIYREMGRGRAKRGSTAAIAQTPWRLLLSGPEMTPARLNETEVGRHLTTRLLVRQIALLSAVTLLFAMVFFYATPRLGDGPWLPGSSGGISGFRPEARLPERGRIHLSNNVVMRVALSKMVDRRPIMLVGEPYFHGEILTDYRPDERGSRWVPWRPASPSEYGRRFRSGLAPMAAQTTTNLIRQEIVLEASTSNRKFAIVPTQPLWDLAIVPYGLPRTDQETATAPRQQRYAVATPAIRSQRQVHAIPNPNRNLSPSDVAAFDEEQERALAFDAARFPRLAQTAADVLAQQELTEGKTLDKIIALERHFHTPDLYRFSLNLDVPRDRELDAIEDFVANHRTGVCQHFASALVLMLRSQGIPARMIVGFRGGAFNSVGHYYVVQGRHAHAWVEAWLPPEDVPDWELAGLPSDGGAWYRLDPTPDRDLMIANSADSVGSRLAQAFDYVELLWRDYVLGLNTNRQEDLVYDPLTSRAAILPSWVESQAVSRWLRRLSRQLGRDFSGGGDRSSPRVFEGLLAALIVCGLVLLLALVQGVRAAIWVVGRWRRSHRPLASAHPPEFYRRLERLLGRLSLVRQPSETPQELAAAAHDQLAAEVAAASAAGVPDDVVAAYYRVRFGGYRLDMNEIKAIEQALATLDQVVRHPHSPAAHENRNRRLPRIGKEHPLSLADGHRARSGAGSCDAKRDGHDSRSARGATLRDLQAKEGDAGGAGDR